MKQNIIHISLTVAALTATMAMCASTAGSTAPNNTTEFSTVVSPPVPKTLKFAGENFSFDRTDMYERLDRELSQLAYTHSSTMLMLKRANRLFPVMTPILKQNGVPEDMVYLACIESTLNQRAYSPAKAAGIWQFMPSTAKQYGLEVNDYVDERYNIEKATAAAARYLRSSYRKYGNWESVAASYNGGMARVTKELADQQATSAYDLWLAEETMRYMFRLLAMKMIMESPQQYGFILSASQLYQPIEYTIVKVNGPVDDWSKWAKNQGIDYLTLREHNPWIRAKSLTNKTGKSYTVRIPTPDSLSRSKQKTKVYNPAWISD